MANGSEDVRPEPPLILSSLASASNGDGLTRETRRVETDTPGKAIWQGVSHISEDSDIGEVFVIDPTGVLINLPGPSGGDASCELGGIGESPDSCAVVEVEEGRRWPRRHVRYGCG